MAFDGVEMSTQSPSSSTPPSVAAQIARLPEMPMAEIRALWQKLVGGGTRKSTDEGLDKEYNSIDAQRDAGHAYIASQRAEGWIPHPASAGAGCRTTSRTAARLSVGTGQHGAKR
jgi:hypothetical protein